MSRLKVMCLVNPEVVARLAPVVGPQANIMQNLGISWNTWIKISAGHPIRLSVAQRLKNRVLTDENFSCVFDNQVVAGSKAALDHTFLCAVAVEKHAPTPV